MPSVKKFCKDASDNAVTSTPCGNKTGDKHSAANISSEFDDSVASINNRSINCKYNLRKTILQKSFDLSVNRTIDKKRDRSNRLNLSAKKLNLIKENILEGNRNVGKIQETPKIDKAQSKRVENNDGSDKENQRMSTDTVNSTNVDRSRISIGTNASKPSFMRRKLLNKCPDFRQIEVDQNDDSFIKTNSILNVYKKQPTDKVADSPTVKNRSSPKPKPRQEVKRSSRLKNVSKNGDDNSANKRASNQSTCEYVAQILKKINSQDEIEIDTEPEDILNFSLNMFNSPDEAVEATKTKTSKPEPSKKRVSEPRVPTSKVRKSGAKLQQKTKAAAEKNEPKPCKINSTVNSTKPSKATSKSKAAKAVESPKNYEKPMKTTKNGSTLKRVTPKKIAKKKNASPKKNTPVRKNTPKNTAAKKNTTAKNTSARKNSPKKTAAKKNTPVRKISPKSTLKKSITPKNIKKPRKEKNAKPKSPSGNFTDFKNIQYNQREISFFKNDGRSNNPFSNHRELQNMSQRIVPIDHRYKPANRFNDPSVNYRDVENRATSSRAIVPIDHYKRKVNQSFAEIVDSKDYYEMTRQFNRELCGLKPHQNQVRDEFKVPIDYRPNYGRKIVREQSTYIIPQRQARQYVNEYSNVDVFRQPAYDRYDSTHMASFRGDYNRFANSTNDYSMPVHHQDYRMRPYERSNRYGDVSSIYEPRGGRLHGNVTFTRFYDDDNTFRMPEPPRNVQSYRMNPVKNVIRRIEETQISHIDRVNVRPENNPIIEHAFDDRLNDFEGIESNVVASEMDYSSVDPPMEVHIPKDLDEGMIKFGKEISTSVNASVRSIRKSDASNPIVAPNVYPALNSCPKPLDPIKSKPDINDDTDSDDSWITHEIPANYSPWRFKR